MSMLAIIGHNTRGKEVIALLEMLGGVNTHNLYGDESYAYYTIDSDKEIKGGIYVCGDKQLCHFTLEEFEKEFPYKIGDKVKVPYEDGRITGNELYEYKILKIKWDYFESMIKYGLPTGDEQRIEYYSTDNLNIWNKKETVEEIKIDIPKGYKFAGVDNDNQKLVFTKIRPQYPKTYEECCEVLGIEEDLWFVYEDIDGNHINPACISNYRIRNLDLYHNFEKLRICRDAHWKIAGEQMGLGKSWEPDYSQSTDANTKYTITFAENEIYTDVSYIFYYFLIFPTEEIRDSFLENFKELIELCKKLL